MNWKRIIVITESVYLARQVNATPKEHAIQTFSTYRTDQPLDSLLRYGNMRNRLVSSVSITRTFALKHNAGMPDKFERHKIPKTLHLWTPSFPPTLARMGRTWRYPVGASSVSSRVNAAAGVGMP